MRNALRAVTLQTVRTLTLWMGPLFLIFIPFDYYYSGPHGPLLAALDACVGILYLAVHLLCRGRILGVGHAHLAAGLVAFAALPYLLANMWVTGLPIYSAGLALWQMALGLILLSWPWLGALLLLSNLAWGYLALRLHEASPSGDWNQYAFILASATVMGIVAHGVRLRATRRLEGLRLEERSRRIELEKAQVSAREVQAVRRVNELKTQFINTAAHELSTPMTPVVLQMRILRDELRAAMTLEQRRSWEVLERNVERLRMLLQDVLDGARLQADHFSIQFQHVDLGTLAGAVVAEYLPSARQASVDLVCHAPDPAAVQGDARRLQQVLANLISNAVKFTPKGGKVEVVVRPTATGAYVQVADTGAGLTAGDIARLFQPFVQVHDAKTLVAGTGLGLYISKGIIDRHGGTIGVRSDGPGHGSSFWFTVP